MRFLGHPLHPMLVHFPVACWGFATGADMLSVAGFAGAWPLAQDLHALGTASALPAMAAGLLDYARLDEAAEADGQRHLILMGCAWSVYLAVLLTRLDGLQASPEPPQTLSFALSLVGFGLMTLGGWYGARLVYHHGAGRRRGNDPLA